MLSPWFPLLLYSKKYSSVYSPLEEAYSIVSFVGVFYNWDRNKISSMMDITALLFPRLVILGLIHQSTEQLCDSKSWVCSSSNTQFQQSPTFVQSGTCLCIAQSSSAFSPSQHAQACAAADGFPADIRNAVENQIMQGFVGQIASSTGRTVFPVWIGLTKTTKGVDLWNDQCTNADASAYANYDGGRPSSTAGAAYSMSSAGAWKGNTPDASAAITYGICRKDQTPCGRNLCQSGSTCVAKGNCFTCTCPSGYSGQYCQQQGDAPGGDSTGQPIAPTLAPLPNCSSTESEQFPSCMPDTIEILCSDESDSTETTCTTISQTTPAVQAAPGQNGGNPNQAQQVDLGREQGPATAYPQSSTTSKGSGCSSWIRCHFLWVILGGFGVGVLLVTMCGLIYNGCPK